MKTRPAKTGSAHSLSPYMSPLAAWAFALGTSIGWGSFVVTSNTYLLQAGPLGTTLGIAVGAAVMVIIARNYHYMMNRYPEAGGVYSYTKHLFGIDYGFMIAWFLGLTYIAMFWANATSLPLFSRYFLGGIFQFGELYTIFGYDVYFGEVLLTIAAIVAACVLCAKSRHAVAHAMAVMALVFVIAITTCFLAAMLGLEPAYRGFNPLFLPDNQAIAQVLQIACISPWAFIGFENISHSAEEFKFSRTKSFKILVIAIITSTLLYVFIVLLSVTAYPPEYDSWLSYIQDLGNLTGIKGLPAFYAAEHYLGSAGSLMLTAALLALVVTSLIGNIIALSRLVYSLAKDNIFPKRFSVLNANAIPANAMYLILAISCLVPFLGRTAIGWIVDVTTIGATIVYGFVSAAAFKMARKEGQSLEKATGIAGAGLMIAFGLMILAPSLVGSDAMATESFILFASWGVLGFIIFRGVIQRDTELRFGKSVVVWIALLSLIMFTSMAWMNQADQATTRETIGTIQAYYSGDDASLSSLDEDEFLEQQTDQMRQVKIVHVVIVLVLFAISFAMLLSNFSYLRKRGEESERKLTAAREAANTDSLTGVKSKHAFNEWELKINQRIAERTIGDFAIAVCDVNGLKQVNDTYGHKAGDEYICSACMLICELFKHSPVFRIGGDEFAVILQGDDYHNQDDILDSFNRTVEDNLQNGKVVVSVGIANFDARNDSSLHETFERADGLMYERKRELKTMGAVTRD